MAKLKAERAHHDGAKSTKDEKPLTTKQRVLGVMAMVVLGGAWLFFFGYGMETTFTFVEERRLSDVLLYPGIPIVIVLALIALAKRSVGLFFGMLITSSFGVFPVLSGIVMFVNVHIGRQVARPVSGTVVHVSRTGNKVISLHYMVRQENGDTLTFVTTRLSKKYQEGDAFTQVMTKGWLRIIYKD